MRRMVGKVIDALARFFFALTRGLAAMTGRSIVTSVILAMALLLFPTFFLLKLSPPVALVWSMTAVGCMLSGLSVMKSYGKAFGERNFAEVVRIRSIIEGKGEPRGPAMRALKRVGDAELLLEFEKWKEAAEVFASIETKDLPALARPGIVSELGYARAHAGDADQGVADIERALAEADTQADYPKWKRFHIERRHGVALSLAGKHQRAIEVLAPLREDFQGNKREWSEAFYFLGLSHAKRSEPDEATGALAAAVFGEGPFVGRAWTLLEKTATPDDLASIREEVAQDRKAKEDVN